MIKLTFQFQKEVMYFSIKNKEIWYADKVWKEAIRCIPKDEKFIELIRNSRNRYSPKLIAMFSLSEVQQKEYESCNTSEEVAEVIIKDCQKKGIRLLKREEENANNV